MSIPGRSMAKRQKGNFERMQIIIRIISIDFDQIDFGLLGRFKLLRDVPFIYDLQTVGVTTDCPRVYDFRSKLAKVTERNLQTEFPSRPHESRRINMFESREVGIGAAREEDDNAEREKLKKLQVKTTKFAAIIGN